MLDHDFEDSRRRRIASRLIAFFMGCAICAWMMGLDVLDPTSIGWIMSSESDIPQHYTGWRMFRHEPWSWPPGAIRRIWEPVGLSIGLTDSIPILAFPMKLASPILPRDFQYLGLWMYLSYGLMGLFTYTLMSRFTRSEALRFLAIPLFVINSAFIMRHGHPALQAHWVLLATLTVYFSPPGTPRPRVVRRLAVIVCVTALIHPYLAVMNSVLVIACLVRPRDLPTRARQVAIEIAAMLAATFGLWYLTGHFEYRTDGVSFRWGPHGFNLINFINPDPTGYSRFLPEFPLFFRYQWQGRSYLGAGGLVLLATAVILWIRGIGRGDRVVTKQTVPLLIAVALLTFFATGGIVSFSDKLLFRWDLPGPFAVAKSTFSASGRFIWPGLYSVLGFAAAVVVGRLPKRAAVTLLAVAGVLQAADARPFVHRRPITSKTYNPILSDERWSRLVTHYPKVTWVPGYETTLRSVRDFRHFLYFLAPRRGSLNAGYPARTNNGRNHHLRTEILDDVRAAQLEPDRLYVVADHGSNHHEFRESFENATTYSLDGYVAFHAGLPPVGVASDQLRLEEIELVDYLESHRNHLVVVSAEAEASEGLTEEARDFLRGMGARHIPGPAEAYVALFYGGSVVHEAVASVGTVRAAWRSGQTVGGVTLSKSLRVSSGHAGWPRSSIVVGNEELSLKHRGLNLCVLDQASKVVDSVSFDTHQSTRVGRLVPVGQGSQ